MRDVATSTTRLALFQSTRSRTNRVWHWRTLRRCRRGMIRMIQAAAHPRTPHSKHPDPPRYTATDPAPPLPTHPHQPHPHPPPQRARESAAGGWWRRRAAGCGRRRRAAGVPHCCGPGCRGRAEIAESEKLRLRVSSSATSIMVLPNQHSPPPPDHLRTTLHYSASPPQNRPCDRPISTAG